ncbi:MAG: hypothetical protein CMJ36_01720 [Phycisphaerae bacterium]|nr:hypothetical protein [Phycisphaerae bacterium]
MVDDADGGTVDFNRDVLPILSNNCFACHGPDENARQAGLRLDTRDDAVAMRDTGKAINTDHPHESLLLLRIGSDGQDRMPPAEVGDALTPGEVEVLRQWIEQGAHWPRHWSFVPPVTPELPDVGNDDWARNPIDRFILARLERESLAPASEANPRTLLRRVTFDLVGLPPTKSEMEAFLADRSADAYERVVDRLLASPRYGEQQAVAWLDIARYADSQGFEKDRPRTMWRYCDWVIDAYNEDMPFDEFTQVQLAGDLLDEPTITTRIATGFHRNTQTNTEGGTDNEEFRSAAVIDRVNTSMQSWMGLTASCAQCHSHKFDPLGHEEYYGLYAFFNQTEDADLDDDAPFIKAPTRDQQEQLVGLEARVASLEKRLSPPDEEIMSAVARWESRRTAPTPWEIFKPMRLETDSGATLVVGDEGVIVAGGDVPLVDTYTVEVEPGLESISALRLEAIEGPDGRGPGRTGHGNFVVNDLDLSTTGPAAAPVTFEEARATYEQADYPASGIIDEDEHGKTGWAIHPNNDEQAVLLRLVEPLVLEDGQRLVITIRQSHGTQHVLERFRLSGTSDAGAHLPLPADIESICTTPTDQRTSVQLETLARHVLEHAPELEAIRVELEEATASRDAFMKTIPTALVMRELPEEKQRATHLFLGGSFMNPDLERGELDPHVPAFLHSWPEAAPRNRLGVARWLVAPDNPLTARTQVNRTWSRIFGHGLVETVDDLGVQGARPSHPELLDWLALHWQGELDWSQKELLRLLVTSATYRQSARATNRAREIDPSNRLLSHAPRLRHGAEQIRDQALAASGLLKTDRIGGPSVTPYLPKGMLPQAFDNYVQPVSTGDDLHRRSLYTDWRRTGHYPAFATFDAPSREFCTIERQRSNTPLQALVLLNDSVFIEAAQALGRRCIEEGGMDLNQRLHILFIHALSRPPTPSEEEVLRDLYENAVESCSRDVEQARLLATRPLGDLPEGMDPCDAAAMTAVSNVIMNLDEFVTRP